MVSWFGWFDWFPIQGSLGGGAPHKLLRGRWVSRGEEWEAFPLPIRSHRILFGIVVLPPIPFVPLKGGPSCAFAMMLSFRNTRVFCLVAEVASSESYVIFGHDVSISSVLLPVDTLFEFL